MNWLSTKIKNFIAGEKAKLVNATPQQKWEYFWDYYKWPTVVVVFLIASVVYTVIATHSQKEAAFLGYCMDSFQEVYGDGANQEPFSDFYEIAGIDRDTQAVRTYVNMTTGENAAENAADVIQRLAIGIAAGEIDFLTAPQQTLSDLSYKTTPYFQDLREILTEEQLATYADRLFYIDESLRPSSNLFLSEDQGSILLPENPGNPDEMIEPIPVAINVRGHEEIDDLYPMDEEPVYLAFIINAPHAELVPLFLEYLLS